MFCVICIGRAYEVFLCEVSASKVPLVAALVGSYMSALATRLDGYSPNVRRCVLQPCCYTFHDIYHSFSGLMAHRFSRLCKADENSCTTKYSYERKCGCQLYLQAAFNARKVKTISWSRTIILEANQIGHHSVSRSLHNKVLSKATN